MYCSNVRLYKNLVIRRSDFSSDYLLDLQSLGGVWDLNVVNEFVILTILKMSEFYSPISLGFPV